MGIHGDKSQQERDWVLNGNFHPHWSDFSELLKVFSNSFVVSEFKYGKAPILIATDVASRGLGQYLPTLLTFTIFKKKVYLLSLTLLLLSEFLPWPEGAVCVAGPWHDKPRFSRGGRRILGGVLTGEAWVSQSCRYTEVTRPECSRTHWPAQKWAGGGHTRWGLGSVPSSCSSVLWKWTAFCTQAV